MNEEPRIRLEPEWREHLMAQFDAPYMRDLRTFLRHRQESGATIYPPGKEYFAAFDYTPFSQVKVVILGQDPYHGPGQAQGLCFSVRPDVRVPPSLVNIYKELEADLGIARADHGCLIPWARSGVFLLNSVLTVEAGKAGAHQGKGWETFTDEAVRLLSETREGLVFLLWGSQAQRKGQLVDRQKHLVLQAPHPSPLSAHRGFLGCRHFSRCNEYLVSRGGQAVDWQLPTCAQLTG